MNELYDSSNVIDAEVVDESSHEQDVARRNFVKSIRAFADFWERTDLSLPLTSGDFYLFVDPSELPRVAKAFGNAKKEVLGDDYFVLIKEFGELIRIRATWERQQVCERVVIGRETVEEKVPVAYEMRTVERDKVEWHCPKVLRPKLEAKP